LEDCLQLLLLILAAQNAVHIHGRNEELTVINLTVAIVVDLLDDLIDLIFVEVHALLLQNVSQLRSKNHTGSVFIDSLELLSELCEVVFGDHLNKDVHCRSFEMGLTSEAS